MQWAIRANYLLFVRVRIRAIRVVLGGWIVDVCFIEMKNDIAMKTQIELLLARLTIIVFALVFLMMAGSMFAQDRLMINLGSSFQDAQHLLAKYPHLRKAEVAGQSLQLSNDYLEAAYNFQDGVLSSMKVSRQYENKKLAFASLEGFIMTMERAGATVYALSLEKTRSSYFAMTDEASYEIVLEKGAHYNALHIKSWKRAEPVQEVELLHASVGEIH